MYRPLKNLIKEKTLARVKLIDETVIEGFVTYADKKTFEIYTADNIYNQVVLDEDGDQIFLENEEDVEAIDFTFVKAIFRTDEVSCIISDVSHKYPVDKSIFIDTIREAVYSISNGNDDVKEKGKRE